MTFIDALKQVNYDEFIHKLTYYTEHRLRSMNGKHREGLEAYDIVFETIRKVMEGKRTWKPDVNIEAFMIQTLKSETSNLIRDRKQSPPLVEIDKTARLVTSDEDDNDDNNNDVNEKIKAIERLTEAGGDEIEISVFNCWLKGIYKPSQIAKELKLEIKEVNKALKRLNRKLTKFKGNEN